MIKFWKMHGAGNDFVLVDNRQKTFPGSDSEKIAAIAERRTGIGCEGIILIEDSGQADFKMRFFNPDGHEVEMCGNGARCAARLAFDLGIAGNEMTIETGAGVLSALVNTSGVTIGMSDPDGWRMDLTLEAGGFSLKCDQVNTGVPHVVAIVEEPCKLDLHVTGRAIRNHSLFMPAGTNVNFMNITDTHNISIRTYERGVEAETSACGTGATACAVIAAKRGLVFSPVNVHCAGGEILVIGFSSTHGDIADVTLTGPAVHVFKGVIDREF